MLFFISIDFIKFIYHTWFVKLISFSFFAEIEADILFNIIIYSIKYIGLKKIFLIVLLIKLIIYKIIY